MKWFQVDSDTPNDPKIKALIRKGLADGGTPRAAALVGHVFLLWCYIANHGDGQPGHGVKGDGTPLSLAEMADECLFDGTDDLIVLLDFLAEKAHIDPPTWRDQRVVILPAMKQRADSYAKSKGRGGGPQDPDPQVAIPAGRTRANAGGRGRITSRTAPELPLQDNTRQDITPEDQNLRGSGDPPPPADLLADAGPGSVDALVQLWNDRRKPGPLVGKLTPQRKALFSRAMKAAPDLADWRVVIDYLNGQPWCNAAGGGDHPNWRASLDWLAKPGKLAEYQDRAKAARPQVRGDGTAGRNAAKGRTGYRPGEFAAALKGGDEDAIH